VIPVRTTWGLAGAAGVVAALAILLASFIAVRRTTAAAPEPGRPPDAWALASAVLWFTLAILPASNLVFVTGILLAERSLYLPSAGLAMAVGVAGRALWTSRASALARPATLVALLVLAGRSVTYVPVWTDHASVFAHLAEAAPESGRSLWQQGDRLLDAGRSDQAVIVYRRAVPVLGSSHAFLLRVGRRLYQDGRPEHARALLARAAEVRPAHVGAPVLLAILETERGRWPEAERWARAILAVEVGRIEAWHMLATALAGQGRWMESARAREALLERGERGAWQQWYWLGEARALAGDPAGARAAADSARGRGADAGALQRLEAIADSVDAAPGDPLQSTGILQNPTPR
jgi:tetratricopeptide (TPR) repeat protein